MPDRTQIFTSVIAGQLYPNPDDPVVTIIEVLPLPPSRTIGNVGVSTGAKQPSFAKILSRIDAYLWLYKDDYGRQPSYITYIRR